MAAEGNAIHVTSNEPRQTSVARMYDALLGGKDNYAADRQQVDGLAGDFPEITQMTRQIREFLGRAVRAAAEEGITQFLDLGCGLPMTPNTHEIAREVQPDARVCYVDLDPVVLAYADALLATSAGIGAVSGDIRDIAAVLASRDVNSLIDFTAPVCVLLNSVLHFLRADEGDAITAAVRAAVAPGSWLVISHGSTDGTDPTFIAAVVAAYGDTAYISSRSDAEIATHLGDFELLPPGLVRIGDWRASSVRPERMRIVAAVGRKPGH